MTEPRSQKFRDLIQALLLSDHMLLFKSPERSELVTFPRQALCICSVEFTGHLR